jgi:hypothetical protein
MALLYYCILNDNDIGNEFCNKLHKHCKNKDIDIIYYNHENPCFYKKNIMNNNFEKLKRILPSKISNLDYDFPLSNTYKLFDRENYINFYYNQKITKIPEQNDFDMNEKSLENSYSAWLKNCNLKMRDVEESIKKYFNIKKLKLLEYYNFNSDIAFPTPSENHMFLLVKSKESNLIGLLNKKVLEAKDLGNGDKLKVIDLPKFIDTNGEFYVFMVE